MPRPIHRAGPSQDPPLHRPDRTAIEPAAPPLLIEEARFALDSPLERNGFHSSALIGNSSWFRPSSADLPAHGHPSSCRPRRTDRVVGRGPERRHSPPGSGGVTPRSRCRRCERVAEPKVRIRSPPAESPRDISPSAIGARPSTRWWKDFHSLLCEPRGRNAAFHRNVSGKGRCASPSLASLLARKGTGG
jgi:hypothetical protein